jgi:hypothetical protein
LTRLKVLVKFCEDLEKRTHSNSNVNVPARNDPGYRLINHAYLVGNLYAKLGQDAEVHTFRYLDR